MNTNELIASLSKQAPAQQLGTPRYYVLRLIAVLVTYAVGAQLALGLRPDVLAQLTQPAFTIEILLLLLLSASSVCCAVLSMYPDMHQRNPAVLNMPFVSFALLAAFILLQLLLQQELLSVTLTMHGIECAICIAIVAVIPSALIFALLRKGTSIHALSSGAFAMLAAAGIGGLTLRLSEVNDSLMHVAGWHYLPTLLCAGFGAWIGKIVLKW